MRKNLLIVEDHADVRKLIRMTLEMEDYRLRELGHAIDALEAAALQRPDLVLLDVHIQGPHDGLELCRRWRSDPAYADMRIVMLTASTATEDLRTARELGAHAYMLKPFSPLQLLDVVCAQLDQVPAGAAA